MGGGDVPNEAPQRSAEQRLRALARANEIRLARAQLKRDLAVGTVRIEQMLAEPPEFARTAKVHELLLAVPKFGPVRAARLLARCGVNDAKTVAGLSERQRQALISHFRR